MKLPRIHGLYPGFKKFTRCYIQADKCVVTELEARISCPICIKHMRDQARGALRRLDARLAVLEAEDERS